MQYCPCGKNIFSPWTLVHVFIAASQFVSGEILPEVPTGFPSGFPLGFPDIQIEIQIQIQISVGGWDVEFILLKHDDRRSVRALVQIRVLPHDDVIVLQPAHLAHWLLSFGGRSREIVVFELYSFLVCVLFLLFVHNSVKLRVGSARRHVDVRTLRRRLLGDDVVVVGDVDDVSVEFIRRILVAQF